MWRCKKCGDITQGSVYAKDGYCGICDEYFLLERYDPLYDKEEISSCPKCKSKNLSRRGIGEYWYGTYEHYEWYCKDCGYSESEFIDDLAEQERIKKEG